MINALPSIDEIELEDIFCILNEIDIWIECLDEEEVNYLRLNRGVLKHGFQDSIISDCISDKVALLCYRKAIFDKFQIEAYNPRDFF